ncbi:MAG: arginine--tRNA ligase [Candidatus Pacebacteria bacterium]|nr:arginine--tRNA ligase [Candidatus Paceibacterota bacterium]
MIKNEIKKIIEDSIKENLKGFKIPEILVEYPKNDIYGDYSTNIALKIAKNLNKSPMDTAEMISSKIKKQGVVKEVKVVSPGFINFFVSEDYLKKSLKEVLKKKDKFGSLKIGKGQKVNVEFVSANPTGPLTLGNGRGGFSGDVLSNVLKKAGYNVTKEYYVNDKGEQIRKLGHSVVGDKEAVYQGKYIEELKKRIKEKDRDKAGEKAAKIILKEMIKESLKKMKIRFDKWSSEKSLYKSKEIDKALKILKDKGLSYQKDNALWFKSTEFGDDKDRVLIKENKEETYLLSDIAYLLNKFKRGFKKLILFWGADHHGYVNRLKAAAQALGYNKEDVEIIIFQLVRLIRDKKEVRMSKRTGDYITLDEVIDEVGLDAARFFFLTRDYNSHLNFDMSLAKEESKNNPVYYVQYAYARISSILRKSKIRLKKTDFNLIHHKSELELIKQVIRFDEVIEDILKDYSVSKLPQYAVDISDAFHRFYENCKVISEDIRVSQERLLLVLAVKIVLKNTLDLMGVSAVEKM